MKNSYLKWLSFGLVFSFMLSFESCQKTSSPVDLVNVFVGTGGHGHTFPGATAPFGMMQLSPDTRQQGWDGCGGYHYSDSFLYGFSHTHLSGTGIADYADILILPMAGEAKQDSTGNFGSAFSHQSENAAPGYYSVDLKDYNIHAELTTDVHSGMHEYTFKQAQDARILINLKYRDRVLDAQLEQISDTEFQGYRHSAGWAQDQRLFFVIKLDHPITKTSALGTKIAENTKIWKGDDIRNLYYFDLKDGESLKIKVGISATSIEGAKKNLEQEIPDWDFELLKDKTQKIWNKNLSKIQVQGDPEREKIFYSALYHSMIAPNAYQDVDGKYLGRDFKVHHADFQYYTVFSLWDTYRAEHPLFSIIDRERTVSFIKTFIRQYEEGGLLPVWELAANETFCMIGHHAIPVIADAIANGIEGFDYEKAYEAMQFSMELPSEDLNAYRSQGFISSDAMGSSVSKTLEYAYDDWCVGKVAQILGKKQDAEKYFRRAQFYKNVFDPETKKMRPRVNGGWKKNFDPREVDFNFTEANSWQYSFYVPQDVEGLIQLSGGDEGFIENLDQLFNAPSETTGREQSDISGLVGQYAHGNEPSHHIAYLYSYAGASWKTQEMAARICNEMYQNAPDGLSGNEDCGQMSAWYVFSSMGFYPVQPASGVYVLGSPQFERASINLENGKTFTVVSKGEGDYIQSAQLNSESFTHSYITYEEIMEGGSLVLEMSKEANTAFGNKIEDRPKSSIKSSLLPTPVVEDNAMVFYNKKRIVFKDSSKQNIIYQIVGDPNSSFKLTFHSEKDGLTSMPTEAYFVKGEKGRSIQLMSKYNNQYRGGGDSCLIDFVRGSTNFSDGKWQGFNGQNIEAIVDLGKVKKAKQISCGFLQDINSWIWLPENVVYEVSLDGQNFHKLGQVKRMAPEKAEGVIIKDYTLKFKAEKIRYIKIKAKSIIDCPIWHKGYAYHGKAWLFWDEMRVE